MNEHEKIIEALWDLSDGEVPKGELAAHLESCPECAEEYKRIKEIKAELSNSAEPVPAELEERVMKTVLAEPRKKRSFYIPIGTISAAAVILLVFTLGTSGFFAQKIGEDASLPMYSAPEAEDVIDGTFVAGDKLDADNSHLEDSIESPAEEDVEINNENIVINRFGIIDRLDSPIGGEVTLLYTLSQEYFDKVSAIVGDTAERYSSEGCTVFICKYNESISNRIEELNCGRYTRNADADVLYFAVILGDE